MNHTNAGSAPRPAVPNGGRTLYLGRKEHKRVSSTAEALVVTNTRGQTTRYPIQRVARIVSCADAADWSGGALALCLRHGIGITWTDTHGTALGAVYAACDRGSTFASALELMLEDTAGITRYQHWLRSRRMRVLIDWRQASGDRLRPNEWESQKREWVYRCEYAAHLPERLKGHCIAYVSQQLADHQLAPILLGPRAETVRLDHDLCQLLWVQMNLESKTLPAQTDTDREITTLFESWATQNASTLLTHLNSLHRCARRSATPSP